MPNQSSFYKTPPHDEEAEKSALGAVLIDSAAISLVAEYLRPDHFYSHEHRLIYQAMLDLFEKQQPIDIVTLKSQLTSNGTLKDVGGVKYLSELMNTVPTSAYVEQYANIVKAMNTKRKLIDVASRSVETAFENTGDIQELIDNVEANIFAIAQEYQHRDFIPMKDILVESFAKLEEFLKTGKSNTGIPTGFTALDHKLAGLHKSNLVILAARPGVGKSTLALNIALHAAMKEKRPIGYFSLEMSKEELVDRLLVGQADIDAWRLKTGKLSSDDTKKLVAAMGELSEAQIYIDDTPGLSILEMRTKARKLKAEKGLELLIVDYLQLANGGKKFESRVQEVSAISQGLKNLARELQIPVLALSQLSRAVEQRGDKKPILADLRESGAIEQDADVVMFIYSEDDGDDLLDSSRRMVKIYVAKHRNGATGEIDLMFRGDRVKFYSVEKGMDL
ncbi:replicative DNA helicase [Candidatus Woesebacteria bacterium]|nr:replicative DNA helicase [Candidatus Woesebacteria bacterium]